MIALFNYDAEEDHELTFKSGDIVEFLGKISEDWWVGRLGNKTGLFPSNYVKLFTEGLL